MDGPMNWKFNYNYYLDILGRVLSGQSFEGLSWNVSDVKVVIRTIAAIDAQSIKQGNKVDTLDVPHFKARVEQHLNECN